MPDRVLRAMTRPVIDHRGPEFAEMTLSLFDELRWVFGDPAHVFVFPSSASGCWEAALTNTLSPGDRVLAYDNGFFAARWATIATRMGLETEILAGDWRRPADPAAIEARLAEDRAHAIRAVLVVHNETSTGVTSDIPAIRAALDRAEHPALLMVDAVSSLGATALDHADWGIDVTVSGSQKGLMLPPGLGFCAASEKALAAAETATSRRAYWDWEETRRSNERGFFPYTPATSLLYGLAEALRMLREEGLEVAFARHARLAEATRRAVEGWGLENYCADPAAYSSSGTTISVPEGVDADALRAEILERYDMSLGTGLGPLEGDVFRIGHLGDFNELMLMGTLAGVAMGLRSAGVPHEPGGVQAALTFLAER